MKTKNLFYLSFVCFIVVMAGMLWTEEQAGCGKIIIPLEFAENITAFKQLITSCNVGWIERNTLLDFVFILTYTTTIFFALRLLIEHLKMSATLLPLTWLVFLPGLFDAVENVHLIKFLYANALDVSPASYGTYYWCVRTKFALLVIALVILLVLTLKRIFGTKAPN